MQQSRQECVGFREFAMHHYNVGWMHKLQLFKDIFYIIFFAIVLAKRLPTQPRSARQNVCVLQLERDQEEVHLESEVKKN